MPAGFRKTIRSCLVVSVLSGAALAQSSLMAGFAAVPNLSPLTRSSGYIFSGTVTTVGRTAATGIAGDVATMQITFRVEQAIRGVRAGQILTIREWAGLWEAGERYHPGERVMLFLYPPSRLGLTSPVGGSQGRFPIDRSGRVMLPPGGITVPAAAAPISTSTATARPRSPTPVIETQIGETKISVENFIREIQQMGGK